MLQMQPRPIAPRKPQQAALFLLLLDLEYLLLKLPVKLEKMANVAASKERE